MLNTSTPTRQGFSRDEVQFYHVEICPLADGMLAIAVSATLCPCEGELTSAEICHSCAHNLDEALAVIKNSVSLN